MKTFFIWGIGIIVNASAFGQGGSNNPPSLPGSQNERWNLNKYLWSNAKHKIEGQDKRIIDFNAIDNWRNLGDYVSVSPNGKHFAYNIERSIRILDYKRKEDSLIVQSVDNFRRSVFIGVRPGFFTSDSKQYIFQDGTALCFLRLDKGKVEYLKDVTLWKVDLRNSWIAYTLKDSDSVVLLDMVTGKRKYFPGITDYEFGYDNEWFVCQKKSIEVSNESKDLLLYQLTTGKEKLFPNVVEYMSSIDGKSLLLKTEKKEGDEVVVSLEQVGLAEETKKIVWSTNDSKKTIKGYVIDNSGKQVVFCVQDSAGFASSNSLDNSIWYYKIGMDKAVQKITNNTKGIADGLAVQESVSFTGNDRYIQFSLQPKPSMVQVNANVVGLEVWGYKDSLLQSRQSHLLNKPKQFQAIVGVEDDYVSFVERSGRVLERVSGNSVLVKKSFGDRFWEKREKDSLWLFNLSSRTWHLLNSGIVETDLWVSPRERYLVYFDSVNCHYISCDLLSGKQVDVSANVNGSQLGYIVRDLRAEKPRFPCGVAAWLEGDAAVLVYDNNDIWQLDLKGKTPAFNLTNGFGKSHDIIFRLFDSAKYTSEIPIVGATESLLLAAFNTRNKQSGFYRKSIGGKEDPRGIYMGEYFMRFNSSFHDGDVALNLGMQPIRARNGNIWIVQRQTDKDAPNYYKTTDFKSFKRLTNFQPQNKYNWLTQELHSFQHLDGNQGQGVLYKPENFDVNKKYPVLIVCYGEYSNNLYQFSVPNCNKTTITPGVSPVWFLNNGYLVFTPDIYRTPPEAFNVMEGAARYLNMLPYVDSGKLGCAFHSASAKLGAYIFTHSKSFAATALSEGLVYANLINVALSLTQEDDGKSQLEGIERGFRFGNFWENKKSWLDQTTVLNTDKSLSPLLLLCNKKSSDEYQNQTLQFFTSLRRLDKKAWWLKYDKGGHTLSDLDEKKDFTIRYTQYLDHFLKDAPAPRWMTRGIPASRKGIDMGYDLDPSGTCALNKANECKICQKWNEQYKKHPQMFTKPISEWHLD